MIVECSLLTFYFVLFCYRILAISMATRWGYQQRRQSIRMTENMQNLNTWHLKYESLGFIAVSCNNDVCTDTEMMINSLCIMNTFVGGCSRLVVSAAGKTVGSTPGCVRKDICWKTTKYFLRVCSF